jgi:hypothetical protein
MRLPCLFSVARSAWDVTICDIQLWNAVLSPASRARSMFFNLILGLTPQALCFRLLRRLLPNPQIYRIPTNP